jgi:hypothetical protein
MIDSISGVQNYHAIVMAHPPADVTGPDAGGSMRTTYRLH